MTKLIKSKENAVYKTASECLKSGGIIIYPTETLYGIGCLASIDKSCRKIISIKNRPENKGMILLVKDEQMMNDYFEIEKKYLKKYKTVKKALTLVLEPKIKFSSAILGENKNVAVRISASPFVKELFNYINEPITSTSANISGEENSYNIHDIYQNFVDKVELVVDSGSLPSATASTIVDLTKTPPALLRKGDLTEKEIEDFING